MIDLASDAVRADPYPAYAAIREAGPAVHDERHGCWYVGRHEDVQAVLKDTESFSNAAAGPEPSLQGADGTHHRSARQLIQPLFSSQRIVALDTAIGDVAAEVVGRLHGRASCEFMSEVAGVLPARVLGWMLGDPALQPAVIRRWSDAIILAGDERHRARKSGGRHPGGDTRGWPEDMTRCEAYLRDTLARAAVRPTGGWVADLLAAEHRAGRLSEDRFVDIALLLIVGATETTTALSGIAAQRLAVDQSLQERLQEHPDLIEPFVEECLRFESPVQRRPRIAMRGARVDRVELPEGSIVVALIGSANRDPTVFSDPDTFRLGRDNAHRHLAFSIGPHVCPGAQLAHREVQALIGTMVRCLPPFRLADPDTPLEQPVNLNLRGPRRLELVF